jgi:hypothetical protein
MYFWQVADTFKAKTTAQFGLHLVRFQVHYEKNEVMRIRTFGF